MAAAHVAYYRNALATPGGLISAKDFQPLPMTGCVIDVAVQWFYARVSVRQEYRNASSAAQSVFGAFYLDPQWSFVGLRAEVENHFILSEMQRLHAERIKTTAPAFSADMVTFDVPWELLGNQTAVVTLTFLCPLHMIDTTQTKLTIPKQIIPVLPLGVDGATGLIKNEDSQWRAKFSRETQARLPKSILIHGKGTLYCAADGNLHCNTVGASVNRMGDPRRFDIKYECRDDVQQPEKDFEIVAKMIPDEDRVMVHIVKEEASFVSDEDRYAMAISVTPGFNDNAEFANPNVEVTFVVDCSGSMCNKIAEVRNALRTAVHGLPSSCFVNVLFFGDRTQWLFPESQQISSEVVAAIDTYRFNASMGQTTRLHDAIAVAYHHPVVQGYARVITLISDGTELKQPRHVVELVADNAHTTRFAAISIGNQGAHPALFKAMAKAGNGVHEHAATPADVSGLLAAMMAYLVVPTLSFVQIHFSYDAMDERPPIRLCSEAPQLVPANTRAVYYALADASLRGCTIRVSGLFGAEQRDFNVHTGQVQSWETSLATEHDVLTVSLAHAAAASARISAVTNNNPKPAMSAQEREEVIRLSVEFGVPSPLTHCYCRADVGGFAADPDGRTVHAPYVENKARFEQIPPVAPVRDVTGACVDPDVWLPMMHAAQQQKQQHQSAVGSSTLAFMRGVVGDITNDVCAPVRIEDVTHHQRVDGTWDHRDFKPCGAVGVSLSQLKEGAPQVVAIDESQSLTDQDFDTWLTALVIARLQQDFADTYEMRLASSKARRFLQSHPKGKAILSEATSYLLQVDASRK